MKYQENDSFVIFLSRPEQRPLRKVAAMDKSSKTSAAMRPITRLTLSVIFALTGCVSLAPDYQRPPRRYRSSSLSARTSWTATAGYQETGWRTFFVDPQVKSLIGTALTNNRDLRMATLKVQEARSIG
jgi:Cu(I)/Ag(I) efflux system outer membrane protein